MNIKPRHNSAITLLFFLIATILAIPSTAYADEGRVAGRHDAQEAVDRFMNSAGLPSSMAVIVTDLSDGKTLAASNEKTALVPASIMKTATIAALMLKKGGEDPVVTNIYTDGRIHKGILDGNIIVEAAGDPSLNSDKAPESPDIIREITDALKAKKVATVRGRIIIDETLFDGPAYPPTWAKGDLPHAYGTGCHALNFRNNSRGRSSVPDPAAIFERELLSSLRDNGIDVLNESVPQEGHNLLVSHKSAPLSEIMRSCMMRSDNLYAESLLRLFAVAEGKTGSTEKGAEAETKLWKKLGVDMNGVNIIDGSGLSRSNRVTATMINDVLCKMADNVDYVSFFPLAGQEGTLRRFLADTPLDSYIAMKTGSMSGIQCYAGYKLDEDFAPTHSVVIIVNDFRCDRSTVRSAVQRMLLSIFNQENPDI